MRALALSATSSIVDQGCRGGGGALSKRFEKETMAQGDGWHWGGSAIGKGGCGAPRHQAPLDYGGGRMNAWNVLKWNEGAAGSSAESRARGIKTIGPLERGDLAIIVTNYS